MGALEKRIEKLGLKEKAEANRAKKAELATQNGKASTAANLRAIVAELIK